METKKKLHSNPCSVLHDKSAGAIFPLSKFTSLYKGPLRPAVEQPHNLYHFIARIQQMHHFRCRMDVNDRRKRGHWTSFISIYLRFFKPKFVCIHERSNSIQNLINMVQTPSSGQYTCISFNSHFDNYLSLQN